TDLMAWFWALSELLSLGQGGIILVYGAWRIMQGTLTIGTMFTILTMVSLMLWPVRQLGRVLTELGKTIVAIDRVRQVLDEPEESALEPPESERGPETAALFEQGIEFRDVTFGYGTGRPALADFTLKIAPG